MAFKVDPSNEVMVALPHHQPKICDPQFCGVCIFVGMRVLVNFFQGTSPFPVTAYPVMEAGPLHHNQSPQKKITGLGRLTLWLRMLAEQADVQI